MPSDVLSLGGIVFDDFSTPTTMMGGGAQAMVTHKLPGGRRVIDTLGPDDADIVWDGQFYGDNAYDTALALDAMRAAGQVVPLSWGGQFRSVILSRYLYQRAQDADLGALPDHLHGLSEPVAGDIGRGLDLDRHAGRQRSRRGARHCGPVRE